MSNTRFCRQCNETKPIDNFVTPSNNAHHVCKRCRADNEKERRTSSGFVNPKVSPERAAWKNMKTRCSNPNYKEYHRYGGRGIKVCDRWAGSFSSFMKDMGPKPTPDHTLDRKENDGNYEPGNCRWATRREQSLNQSRNRVVDNQGSEITIQELSELTGIHRETLATRLDAGKSGSELTTPPRKAEFFSFQGTARTISEWSALTGIHYATLYSRIKYAGWPMDRALTEPT